MWLEGLGPLRSRDRGSEQAERGCVPLALDIQSKVSERHLTKAGIERRIEGRKMQVGVEMGLKFSTQCPQEVGGRSDLSERYLEKAEFEWSVMGLGKYVEQAGAEMGSDISNQ